MVLCKPRSNKLPGREVAERPSAGASCLLHALALRHGDTWTAFPLMCKGWGCPRCQPRLAKKWATTLHRCEFRPTAFATFTQDPKTLEREGLLGDPKGERKSLGVHLSMVWQQLRRESEGPVRYWRVYEAHRSGRLHCHALIEGVDGGGFRGGRGGPRYRKRRDRVKHVAERLGLGWTRAYSLPPGESMARAYCLKYSSKLDSKTVGDGRARVVACSQNIRHLPRVPTDADEVVFLTGSARFGSGGSAIECLAADLDLKVAAAGDLPGSLKFNDEYWKAAHFSKYEATRAFQGAPLVDKLPWE